MKKICFALQRTKDQNLNYHFISSIGLTGEFHDCLGDQKISQKTGRLERSGAGLYLQQSKK